MGARSCGSSWPAEPAVGRGTRGFELRSVRDQWLGCRTVRLWLLHRVRADRQGVETYALNRRNPPVAEGPPMGALKRRGTIASLIAALLLAAPTVPGADAQQGPGDGGGGGGGEDGSGGLYSDLVLALRDVDGLPIMASFEVASEEGVTTEYCVQPVVADPLPGMTEADAVVNPVDGRQVYKVPLVGDGDVVAEEDEVCDPQPAYAMYVQEAELERLNMADPGPDARWQHLRPRRHLALPVGRRRRVGLERDPRHDRLQRDQPDDAAGPGPRPGPRPGLRYPQHPPGSGPGSGPGPGPGPRPGLRSGLLS